jgi:uncharacterized protein
MATAENPAGAAAGTHGVTRVGLISDTHGWLDPRVLTAFDREGPLAWILHAGDVGSPDVLWPLEHVAPVRAVLGNCDFEIPGYQLGSFARLTVAGTTFALIHNIAYYAERREPGDDVVVYGHSHRPAIESDDGVLYVNPGSATQRRMQPGCSVGIVDIAENGTLDARIIELDDFGPRVR